MLKPNTTLISLIYPGKNKNDEYIRKSNVCTTLETGLKSIVSFCCITLKACCSKCYNDCTTFYKLVQRGMKNQSFETEEAFLSDPSLTDNSSFIVSDILWNMFSTYV
ncbi:serine arginine repetitive matrix 1 [Schistosoma japonicum]|nr:serine arginine repetitive matrix 1 [Schistosoma japonicum]